MAISLLRESRLNLDSYMSTERVVLWGTPDLGKPRVRILREGLRAHGILSDECVSDIWSGVEDKSQVKGALAWIGVIVRYCMAYPVLIFRYLRVPRHDAVLVAYMGHLDVLILWPFAKMRGVKIVWDAFLSLYDTAVEDRRIVSARHPLAWIIQFVERLACNAADIVVLDTEAHAEYFRREYRLCKEKVVSVWVGAETTVFRRDVPAQSQSDDDAFDVLFYGQFIPLHGIEHIVDAARRTPDPSVRWTIVGCGQERAKIDALVNKLNLPSLKLIDWVDYRDLPALIAQSDLCLGVFGASDKAARVIPNKVFQILAMGKPLATADTPAIREIVTDQTPGVWLVPPGSGAALAEAVAAVRKWKAENGEASLCPGIEDRISPQAVARSFMAQLKRAF